jgi:hypothetical protein
MQTNNAAVHNCQGVATHCLQVLGRQVLGRQVFGRQVFGRQIFGRQIFGRQAFDRQGPVFKRSAKPPSSGSPKCSTREDRARR